MLTFHILLAAQVALASAGWPQSGQARLKPPRQSQQTTAIWENIWVQGGPTGTVRIPSPDGKKTITATYNENADQLKLIVSWNRRHVKVAVVGGVGSEVAWSSDSDAFFLTWSDAGLGGEFHTRIFYVSETSLRQVSLDSVVKRAFGHPVTCDNAALTANVIGIAWLESSSRVLVAAEVPPITLCDSFGIFKAFEISVPNGIVVKPYDQLAAKKKFWSYLGPRLREAPDECITKPKSCEVPYLHAVSN
jgi:hypothetical protein